MNQVKDNSEGNGHVKRTGFEIFLNEILRIISSDRDFFITLHRHARGKGNADATGN
jgi:hypothetical protein